MRKTVLFLLFAVPALGQSMEQRIDHALDVRTSPEERGRLLREVASTNEGAAYLGKRLSPMLDPEVTHAVVSTLLSMPPRRYEPLVQQMCRLMNDDSHAVRVGARIEETSRTEGAETTLVKWIADIATGDVPAAEQDAKLRRGAVRALGVIPRRSAIEAIVTAWSDDDPGVRSDCARVLGRLMTATTPDEAAAFLRAHPYLSYEGLLRERVDDLIDENKDLAKHRARALARATADEAFEELGNGDETGHTIASKRLLDLATKGELERPQEFASRVFDAFVRHRDRSDPTMIANLCRTMAVLWKGGPLRKAKKPEEILGALEPLSGGGAELSAAGNACIDLMREIGDPALVTLVDFASDFKAADVRRSAIQALGTLAARSKASRDYVGPKLATMLASGDDEPVRKQILSTLAADFPGVAAALEPVRALLGGDGLSGPEVVYALEILQRIATDESFTALKQVSATHPKVEVRRLAVRGLLESTKRIDAVIAHLKALVESADQPLPYRTDIVSALGRSGWRGAHDVLVGVFSNEAIDGSLRDAAREADLVLGETLARPRQGTKVTAADVATGLAIFEAHPQADPARREALARALVDAAAGAQIPVGAARYRIATAYRARKDADPVQVLKLLKEAATKAKDDGLAPGLERELCLTLRKLLIDAQPDANGWADISDCDKRLSELTEDPNQALTHLLDAADSAVKAKRRGLAEELLKLVMRRAPLDPGAQTRFDALAANAKQLPAGS